MLELHDPMLLSGCNCAQFWILLAKTQTADDLDEHIVSSFSCWELGGVGLKQDSKCDVRRATQGDTDSPQPLNRAPVTWLVTGSRITLKSLRTKDLLLPPLYLCLIQLQLFRCPLEFVFWISTAYVTTMDAVKVTQFDHNWTYLCAFFWKSHPG